MAIVLQWLPVAVPSTVMRERCRKLWGTPSFTWIHTWMESIPSLMHVWFIFKPQMSL